MDQLKITLVIHLFKPYLTMNNLSDIRNLEQIIEDTKQAIIYWQDDPTYVDWLRNELSKYYAKLNKLEQST